jgi:hypothetical protein
MLCPAEKRCFVGTSGPVWPMCLAGAGADRDEGSGSLSRLWIRFGLDLQRGSCRREGAMGRIGIVWPGHEFPDRHSQISESMSRSETLVWTWLMCWRSCGRCPRVCWGTRWSCRGVDSTCSWPRPRDFPAALQGRSPTIPPCHATIADPSHFRKEGVNRAAMPSQQDDLKGRE